MPVHVATLLICTIYEGKITIKIETRRCSVPPFKPPPLLRTCIFRDDVERFYGNATSDTFERNDAEACAREREWTRPCVFQLTFLFLDRSVLRAISHDDPMLFRFLYCSTIYYWHLYIREEITRVRLYINFHATRVSTYLFTSRIF